MGEVVETQPTIGSNVEEVVHKNVHFVSRHAAQEQMKGVFDRLLA